MYKISNKLILGSDSDEDTESEISAARITLVSQCEVTKFMKLTIEDEEENNEPGKVWKKLEDQFLRLSLISRSVLTIPATQNKPERDFSVAGNTLTYSRCRVDPQHVDELLVIRDVIRK